MVGSGRSNPTRSRTKSSSSEPSGDTKPAARPRIEKRRGQHHRPIKILKADVKIMVGIALLAAAVILVTVYNLLITEQAPPPRVVTPFPSPKLMDLPQFQGEHKESLYWGTYRPHVYLGIRARTPRSLLAGLMWIGNKDGMYSMRHVCQDSDDLSTYGWLQHNGLDFGHQVLVDQDLRLSTSFVKSKSEGSGYGGDWAIRIDMQSAKLGQNEEIQKTGHLFFYLADEDMDHSLKIQSPDIRESSLLASGVRPDVGGWQLHLKSEDPLELHYAGFRTPNIHNLSDLVQLNVGSQVRKFRRLGLSDTSEDSPNILVIQISGRIPFSIDLSFLSGARAEAEAETLSADERLRSLTGSSLSSKLREKEREFDDKFSQCFNITDKLDFESVEVGKAAISNMLGGIGYFYGESRISYPNISNEKPHDNFISYWPAELYTAVPSRPFFPRGFLWDEGFHQLLIWRWDVRISLDIIGHWLDLMNIDGWIPREQILGSEALSKVPEEFVAQYPSNANPPTLFLVIHDLLDGIKGGKFTTTEISDITTFLERAFVRLEAWFRWFNTSQSGKETSSYFWHGRDSTTKRELNPKTLSSGLDDYPRASHPNDDERHLDLRSWMLLAAECMLSISQLVNTEEVKPLEDYQATAALLSNFDLLNKIHFDPAYGAYFDYGNHTEKVRLIWKESMVGNGYATRKFVQEVFDRPELKLVTSVMSAFSHSRGKLFHLIHGFWESNLISF